MDLSRCVVFFCGICWFVRSLVSRELQMTLGRDTGTSSIGRPTIPGDCAAGGATGREPQGWVGCSHIYVRSVQMMSLFWGSCWFVRLPFSLEIEFRMLDQAVRIFSGSVRMCRLLLRDLLVCAFARFPRTHNGVKPGHWNQQHRQTDHPGRLCCWWCDWSGATGVGGLVIRTLQNSSSLPPFV